MNYDITTLRSHLFETLTALRDKEKPMEIARAKAISDVSQTIINSARLEVDFAKATGAKSSAFLQIKQPTLPAPTPQPSLPPGITGVTQHRIK